MSALYHHFNPDAQGHCKTCRAEDVQTPCSSEVSITAPRSEINFKFFNHFEIFTNVLTEELTMVCRRETCDAPAIPTVTGLGGIIGDALAHHKEHHS